jgi:transposase
VGKSKPAYPAEFRAEAVRLARTGQPSIAQIARDLGVSDGALRNWIRQADLNEGRRTDGLTSAEREELTRLRRENRVLKDEREILKKVPMILGSPPQMKMVVRWRILADDSVREAVGQRLVRRARKKV